MSEPTSTRSVSGEPDETSLLAGLRRGEEAAFELLVRTYGGRLLQVARRFVGEDDARDALQEAFLSAFKSIGRFDGRSKISTWLHRIVVNSALMRLRKKSSKVEESLEPLLPTFIENGHRADPGRRVNAKPRGCRNRACWPPWRLLVVVKKCTRTGWIS